MGGSPGTVAAPRLGPCARCLHPVPVWMRAGPSRGKTRDAMSQFAKNATVDPGIPGSSRRAGLDSSTDPHPELRNGDESGSDGGKGLPTGRPATARPSSHLGGCLCRGRPFTEAVATAREGRELAAAQGPKEIETKAGRLLADLQAGHPFREPLDTL